MKVLLIIIGITIQIIVFVDIFKTIIYINGGGILSGFTARAIWKTFYKLANGNGSNKLLNLCGPIILLFLLFMWINLFWLSYSLIFISEATSVIDNRTDTPASILDKIYFVGYTLTSLGNGGFRAGNHTWQIITNIAGINSLVFISLGISYLIPVLQAVIDKRTLAVHINKLGATPQEIIKRGYNGRDFDPLYQRFSNLETYLIKHGERHLAYPILHYFHSSRRESSMTLSLAVLDEVITIQEVYNIDDSSKNYHWQVLRGALNNFYERLDDNFIQEAKEVPPFDYINKISSEFANRNTSDAVMKLHKLEKHRKMLLGYVQNNGWNWEDVISADNEEKV